MHWNLLLYLTGTASRSCPVRIATLKSSDIMSPLGPACLFPSSAIEKSIASSPRRAQCPASASAMDPVHMIEGVNVLVSDASVLRLLRTNTHLFDSWATATKYSLTHHITPL